MFFQNWSGKGGPVDGIECPGRAFQGEWPPGLPMGMRRESSIPPPSLKPRGDDFYLFLSFLRRADLQLPLTPLR